MKRRSVPAAVFLTLALSAACAHERSHEGAIVVAIANSPAILDPRIAADEASQKAHQLIFNTLMRVDHDRANVAVFQPALEGVALSPIADFMFLKDVRRRPAETR